MKRLEIQIRIRPDMGSPEKEWCLGLSIDRHQLDGVAREAAGLDGCAEWRAVEHFVHKGVRDALLSWAEKEMPQVARIRAERDLLYAAVARYDTDPHAAMSRLDNFARRELKAEESALEETFAQFLFANFGGWWNPQNLHGPGVRERAGIPARVDARVAELFAELAKRSPV